MAVEFQSSKTRENLMRVFAGESQARNRYTFAAQEAAKQKLHVIEAVFTFTANQEKEHAQQKIVGVQAGQVRLSGKVAELRKFPVKNPEAHGDDRIKYRQVCITPCHCNASSSNSVRVRPGISHGSPGRIPCVHGIICVFKFQLEVLHGTEGKF